MSSTLKRCLLAALLALSIASSGCVSHYSDGPEFRSVRPPQGLAVVYVYRPKQQWGMLSFIDAFVYGRHVSLCSGSFAAFVVPPGPLRADIRILAFASAILVNGFGTTAVATRVDASDVMTPIPIDVRPGETYFIKTEFSALGDPPDAELVSPSDGLDDIDGLSLIPGGRGRWPVYLPPPPQQTQQMPPGQMPQ